MSKRLKHDTVLGPNGEVLKVSWMPDNRVRFDFINCGTCAVTKIFAKERTNIELNYRTEKRGLGKPAKPETKKVADPLQRQSSISGREYRIITPSKNAQPYTAPAAMACLRIIKDCCAAKGFCTEGELKSQIIARASEITKIGNAWRFLQFYRPYLEKAEMITYKR